MLYVVGIHENDALISLCVDGRNGVLRTFITRREAQFFCYGMNAKSVLPNVKYIPMGVDYLFQEDRCACGDHDIRQSATHCEACGEDLCELCGSADHSASGGHNLNNPAYWGV